MNHNKTDMGIHSVQAIALGPGLGRLDPYSFQNGLAASVSITFRVSPRS